MSVVSSRVALRHRCSIERDIAEEDDSWGHHGDPDWQPHLEEIPCRAWTEAAREPVDERSTVTYEDRRLILESGTDVRERDRIAAVTDANESPIFEGPMGIEGVLTYPDHIEILLERIR